MSDSPHNMKHPLRLVFCGTPEFAVPTLNSVVAAGDQVLLVVTQPDRPSGRGMELQFPPVKSAALAHNIPVTQPDKIKNNTEFRQLLETLRPDAILVVAYGRIIPNWMLELPRFGNINLHGSLLPKYRGAAPIQWAVANGEKVTGVTTIRIDEGLDTGDMLLAQAAPIGPEETAADLFKSLATIGADLMVRTLAGLATGTVVPQPQDHSQATLAPVLKREDGLIDFSRTARQIYDRWRGFQPWPGAYTGLRGKKLIVHRMHPVATPAIEPGTLLIEGDTLLMGCSSSVQPNGQAIALDEVQLEGRRRMPAAEFLRGFQVRTGERLGQ